MYQTSRDGKKHDVCDTLRLYKDTFRGDAIKFDHVVERKPNKRERKVVECTALLRQTISLRLSVFTLMNMSVASGKCIITVFVRLVIKRPCLSKDFILFFFAYINILY